MKKWILTTVLFSTAFLSGCKENSPSAEQYYVAGALDIQLFDDQPPEEYAQLIMNIKKSRDKFYLKLSADNTLNWYNLRKKTVIHPDHDGYYPIDINRFRLNKDNPDKPQLISDRNDACIRECVITLTLKPVAEESDEIRKIKSSNAILESVFTAGYLSQADVFTQHPLTGFNGKTVSVGWPEISPHSMKLNFSDTLTETEPDDDIKMYLSWLNLPYHPENIRAYHYNGSRYNNGVVMAVKESDPVTDLKPMLKKMNATVFNEGQGAVFYSDTESLTGLYYYYDAPVRVLYLAVLPDSFTAVSDYFIRDYSVVRTLNPDNTGAQVQESDLSADKDTFEKKFKTPLNDYIDKDRLTGFVTERVNDAVASPKFFFRYPEKETNKKIRISLSRLSGFFEDTPVTLFATLHKATVTELLTELKEKYPQGRIYQDIFINDSPPVFYILGETNAGLTLQYTFPAEDEDDTGNDLMIRVIIAQLLRQISPLQLNPVDPVRLTHFQEYQMGERYMGNGYDTTQDNEFISFNSLLLRSDTGEVIIRNPPENHTVYTRENGLIQARDANLKHDGDTLKLYTPKGEFIVSGRQFEFTDEGNAVTVTQCCGTGVFDLNRRKWLIEPKLAYISDYNGFYIAKVQYRQPAKVIFNHRGDILGYGTSIITSVKNRQILIFDGTIDSGRWLNGDGTASENPVVTETITLPQGTFYIIRMDDRIMLLDEQANVIIPAFDYSKYKTGKTGLWLWSVREHKWIQPDIDRIFRNLYG